MRSLRLPGTLIALGYAGIVIWTITILFVFPPRSDTASQTLFVYWVTTTLGYGFAGFACWRWIASNVRRHTETSRIRVPSRWMAAASLTTAAGTAALTFEFHGLHSPFASPHYHLRLAGYVAGTLGFLLAAVGFWIASYVEPLAANEVGLNRGPLQGEAESEGSMTRA